MVFQESTSNAMLDQQTSSSEGVQFGTWFDTFTFSSYNFCWFSEETNANLPSDETPNDALETATNYVRFLSPSNMDIQSGLSIPPTSILPLSVTTDLTSNSKLNDENTTTTNGSLGATSYETTFGTTGSYQMENSPFHQILPPSSDLAKIATTILFYSTTTDEPLDTTSVKKNKLFFIVLIWNNVLHYLEVGRICSNFITRRQCDI